MLKKGVSFLEKMNIDKEKLQAAKASTADYLGELKAIVQEKSKQEEASREVVVQQGGDAQVQIRHDETVSEKSAQPEDDVHVQISGDVTMSEKTGLEEAVAEHELHVQEDKKKGLFTYQHGDKEIVVEKNDVLDAAELLVDVSSPRGAAKRLIKVMRD